MDPRRPVLALACCVVIALAAGGSPSPAADRARDCRSELPSVRGISLAAVRCVRGAIPSAVTLRRFRQREDVKPGTPYTAALQDIGGGRKRELVIELKGSDWCGTGGCTVFVFRPDSRREVARIPTARVPLVVAGRVRHEWHDLLILRSGGGGATTYTRTTYTGRRYSAGSSDELGDGAVVRGRAILAAASRPATGRLP